MSWNAIFCGHSGMGIELKVTKIIKFIGILLAFYIVYLLTAMLIPFAHQKTVSDKNQTFDPKECYSNTVGVDRAALIEDNDAALEERIRLIQGAKKEIIMSTFDMREGESTKDIISALQDAADRGVQVEILVDGISSVIHMQHSLFYALGANAGIHVKAYNVPNLLLPWTINGRMHDKYLIADNKVMILGGRNTYDYFLGDYIEENKSYDRDLLVYNTKNESSKGTGSVIEQTKDYFQTVWSSSNSKDWHNDTTELSKDSVSSMVQELKSHYEQMKVAHSQWFQGYSNYEGRTEETNKITLLTGEIGIYGKEPLVFYKLQKLMEQAKNQVRIHSPYAVLNGDMRDGLRRVAQTVPNTSMMINSRETGDNFVASSDYFYHKKSLAEMDIGLMEFVGDMSYHGKSIVIDDDVSIVGSFNMDMRSAYVDTEVMLVVDSQKITKQLSDTMDQYENQAKKVVISEDDEVVYGNDELLIDDLPWYMEAAQRVTGVVLWLARYLI